MLRYFYLLCLIIYIKETVSYDHKYYKSFKPTRSHKHPDKKLIKLRDRNIEKFYKTDHNIRRRRGFGSYSENDFTQIDVASFIQKPDLYAKDNSLDLPQNDFKSQLIPKHLSEYEDINKMISNMNNDYSLNNNDDAQSNHDSNLNYISNNYLEKPSKNMKHNEVWKDDFKHIFETVRDTKHTYNQPKKRCYSNYTWKFPFFFRKSHRRNISNDMKKQQREAEFDYDIGGGFTKNGIKKRTNKIISKNSTRGGDGTPKCHNSRQFFQKLVSANRYDYNITELQKTTTENDDIVESNKQELNTQTCLLLPSDSTSYLSKDTKKKLRKRKGNINKKKTTRKKSRREYNFSN